MSFELFIKSKDDIRRLIQGSTSRMMNSEDDPDEQEDEFCDDACEDPHSQEEMDEDDDWDGDFEGIDLGGSE